MKSPFLVGFGLFLVTREECRLLRSTWAVLLFSSVPVLFVEESWMERISQEAKERHERKPLKQDGVAERLLFLKGSVKWDDPAVISAAGNCMVFVHVACPLWPMCSHPSYFPLSLPSCSFLFPSTFVHEAQARDACYPFDIFSVQVVLARLWNRSSCNTGSPQQVSCPASVLSLCIWRGQSAAVPWLQLQPARNLYNLPPVTLTHRRRKVLIHCLMGSALAPAFP